MCYNCGCKITTDQMGDNRNITLETFDKLAIEWNITAKAAREKVFIYLQEDQKQNIDIEQIFKQASAAWGQLIPDAKKETFLLLQKEFASKVPL